MVKWHVVSLNHESYLHTQYKSFLGGVGIHKHTGDVFVYVTLNPREKGKLSRSKGSF